MASPKRQQKRRQKAKQSAMGSRRKKDIRRADRAKIEEMGRKLGIVSPDKAKEEG